VRLAVYTDYPYARSNGAVLADRAFALFIARLAPAFDRVIALGRLDPSGEAGRYPIGDEVEFVALPFYAALTKPLAALSALAGSLRAYWAVLNQVDAVWLLGPHPFGVLFALVALARRRRVVLGVRQDLVPYVRARHPGRTATLAAAWLLEMAYRALSRACPVVVVGPGLARNYRHARAVLEIAVSLVPAADVVDPDGALRRGANGERVVLSVGRLEAEKNPLLLADALAALAERDSRWQLVVCGEGPMRGELAARLERLRVSDRASLRGYVPNHEGLTDVYRSSDVFLHVSWTEGLPQVLLEAFAAGVPVVATDVGGVGESVRDAALLIPPGDASAAAAAVERIASDGDLRERLVRAGNAFVRERTAEAESERVADFLIGRRLSPVESSG
jgi:glycosyltransferase involved in cell wall biosynthesis